MHRERDRDRDTKKDRGERRERPRSQDRHGSERRHQERHNRQDGDRHHGRHHHSHSHRKERKDEEAKPLPYNAPHLSKSALDTYLPVFASYLSIQKDINIATLDDHSLRGRWKSFLGKWNRGDLAEGWYEPQLFERLASQPVNPSTSTPPEPAQPPDPQTQRSKTDSKDLENSDSDSEGSSDYGPLLPPSLSHTHHGPSIPTTSDLTLRNEAILASSLSERETLRATRKADRALQKSQLEELLPRADPGSRERRLEKRKELNEKMKGFREKSPGGDEVAEEDLVGGGEGEYKRLVEMQKSKKEGRETRREEERRAREEERKERVREYWEREEEVRRGLRELAEKRFG